MARALRIVAGVVLAVTLMPTPVRA